MTIISIPLHQSPVRGKQGHGRDDASPVMNDEVDQEAMIFPLQRSPVSHDDASWSGSTKLALHGVAVHSMKKIPGHLFRDILTFLGSALEAVWSQLQYFCALGALNYEVISFNVP